MMTDVNGQDFDPLNPLYDYWHTEGDGSVKKYRCPKGHKFETANPIIIAVDNDPEYNSGPVCSYCYVDWFKVNVNAEEDIAPQ